MSTFSQFHNEVVTLTLEGTGETQEDALNQILGKMRKQLMQDRPGTALFMAPLNVEVTKRTLHTRTESFLGVLWPRVRHQHQLEARIEVEVRWLQFTVSDGQEVTS